jgi:hypothetical protein
MFYRWVSIWLCLFLCICSSLDLSSMYERKHVGFGFLILAGFTLHDVLQLHPFTFKPYVIIPYGWVIFHCAYMLHSPDPFISFSLLHVHSQFSQQNLLKRLSFLHHGFWDPLLKISWLLMPVFMSGSSILIRWSPCLFLCQYHAIFNCYGSVI